MSFTTDWQTLAVLTTQYLERNGAGPSIRDTSLQLSPLHLPYSSSQIRVELEQLGCSDRSVSFLVHTLRAGLEELSKQFQRCFLETMQGTAPTLDQEGLSIYECTLRGRYEADFETSLGQSRKLMLDEVRLYRSRPPKEIMARHGTGYTSTITDILSAVFHQKDKISMAEKRRLASVTGLTENQVAVWVRLSSLCPR